MTSAARKLKVKPRVTALDVEHALRERHQPPAWAFLTQVRNGTGYDRAKPRTADALAFSAWPSRGLELHGFEIKVDRTDVRRELANPEKAEEFIRFCDRWWLAVSDEDIVQPGELPPTWGLLVLQGKRMVCRVEAPKLEPLPLDRLQLAAIFRCLHETTVPAVDVAERIEAATKEAIGREKEFAQDELKRLRAKVADFERASGVTIGEPWSYGEQIGEAVRLVLDHRHAPTRDVLDRQRKEARGILAMLDALAAAAGETR